MYPESWNDERAEQNFDLYSVPCEIYISLVISLNSDYNLPHANRNRSGKRAYRSP